MKTVKVRDLKIDDKVDMENVHPDYKDPLAEFEYGIVDTIEQETPDCFVIHFANMTSIALPPEQELQVDDATPETRKGIAQFQVESKQAAIAAATQLIERSAWYEVEPRPFDWYCFSIKAGEGHEIIFKTVERGIK